MHLEGLRESGDDPQAAAAVEGAVTVSTWHAAKGLEWPVAVLFELWTEPRASALGLHVVSDRPAPDLTDPLAGRRIRFWPNPFHPSQIATPFHARLAAAPASVAAEELERRQSLRLLYVGWTRARDRLALAHRAGSLASGALQVLRESDRCLIDEPAGGVAAWCGRRVDVQVRPVAPSPAASRPATPGAAPLARGPRAHPPAFAAASAAAPSLAAAAKTSLASLGSAVVAGLGASLRPQALGNALHAFFACDDPAENRDSRRRAAEALLETHGCPGAISPIDAVRTSDALHAWIERAFPGARLRREWPVLHRVADGTVLRGVADLVIETAEGPVLVDHKCLAVEPGSEPAVALAYAGQLEAYARALEAATGRRVRARYIHLPMVGAIVEVT